MRRIALLCVALLGGCSVIHPHVEVLEPTTARPEVPQQPPVPTGSIYQAGTYRPLFEDRRARHVGDILVIQLNEKLNASKNAASSVDKSGSVSMAVPIVRHLPGKSFQGAELDARSANEFEGKGSTQSSNLFTGTIAVTVVEVLPNGNLVVSGEKQIGISKNTETLRFSGVVNPSSIVPPNTVSSTQVADARIDYRGSGYIDEAQVMGWLSRFFLSFLPF
ncbi:MAG: flagellar basal body L-ring protein FlgH [Pseudomonadota bacterium]|mgnify:CR=1 FL=1|nr:MAG: flagellar biosynthesis protein FlgH [Pseudomonadota bacterium]